MAVIIAGVFPSRDQAESAIRQLCDQGFRSDQVGYVVPGALARAAGKARPGGREAFSWVPAQQVVFVRDVGPVQLAGLPSQCVSATPRPEGVDLVDILTCLGIEPDHARWYDQQVREGYSLVLVRTEERADQAEAIMRQAGSIIRPEAPSPAPARPAGGQVILPGTRPAIESVEPGWTVCSSDGKVIGQVDEIGPAYLLVRRGTLLPQTLYVPFSAVREVEPGLVVLNVRSDEVRQQHWDRPPAPPAVPTTILTKLTEVRPGFDVYTSDGQKIGVVQEAVPDCLHVLCCSHLYVPPSRVADVTDEQVILNVPRDQLEEYEWRTCVIPRHPEYEIGGAGYSGVPPREHEPGVQIPPEMPASPSRTEGE